MGEGDNLGEFYRCKINTFVNCLKICLAEDQYCKMIAKSSCQSFSRESFAVLSIFERILMGLFMLNVNEVFYLAELGSKAV